MTELKFLKPLIFPIAISKLQKILAFFSYVQFFYFKLLVRTIVK